MQNHFDSDFNSIHWNLLIATNLFNIKEAEKQISIQWRWDIYFRNIAQFDFHQSSTNIHKTILLDYFPDGWKKSYHDSL